MGGDGHWSRIHGAERLLFSLLFSSPWCLPAVPPSGPTPYRRPPTPLPLEVRRSWTGRSPPTRRVAPLPSANTGTCSGRATGNGGSPKPHPNQPGDQLRHRFGVDAVHGDRRPAPGEPGQAVHVRPAVEASGGASLLVTHRDAGAAHAPRQRHTRLSRAAGGPRDRLRGEDKPRARPQVDFRGRVPQLQAWEQMGVLELQLPAASDGHREDSGQRLPEFLQQKIFGPLQLHMVVGPTSSLPGKARSYRVSTAGRAIRSPTGTCTQSEPEGSSRRRAPWCAGPTTTTRGGWAAPSCSRPN